jgi:hypothetical protein
MTPRGLLGALRGGKEISDSPRRATIQRVTAGKILPIMDRERQFGLSLAE